MKILINIVAAVIVLAVLVIGGAFFYVNTDVFPEHKAKQACINYFKGNMRNPDSLKVRSSKIVPNEDGSLSIRLNMKGTNASHGRCITKTEDISKLDYGKTIEINKSLDAMSDVLHRASQ